MITDDRQLDQAIESLKLLYGALAAMHRDILPINPQRFALYAEGRQDEIACIQSEIDEYTGRTALAAIGTGHLKHSSEFVGRQNRSEQES